MADIPAGVIIEQGQGTAFKEQQRIVSDLFRVKMQQYDPKPELYHAKQQVLFDTPYKNLAPQELDQKAKEFQNQLTDPNSLSGGLYDREITEMVFEQGVDSLARNQIAIRNLTERLDPFGPETQKKELESIIDRGQFMAEFMYKGLGKEPADINGAVRRKVAELRQSEKSVQQSTNQQQPSLPTREMGVR